MEKTWQRESLSQDITLCGEHERKAPRHSEPDRACDPDARSIDSASLRPSRSNHCPGEAHLTSQLCHDESKGQLAVGSGWTWTSTESSRLSIPSVKACRPIRNICGAGLVLVFMCGIASLASGSYMVKAGQQRVPPFLKNTEAWIGLSDNFFRDPGNDMYYTGRWACSASKSTSTLLPLFTSYAITALLDSTGRIQSTTLRWGLYQEDRLHFHSNPRMFSATRRHWPNSWYLNAITSLAHICAYGAQALLITEIDVVNYIDEDGYPVPGDPRPRPQNGIDFCGWAFLVLGLALLAHTSVMIGCLVASNTVVRTWSNHIKATINVATADAGISKSSIVITESPETFNKSALTHSRAPVKSKQRSAREVVPSVRWLNLSLWLLFGFSTTCTVIVTLLARFLPAMDNSVTKSYLKQWGQYGVSLQGYWTEFGMVFFMISPTAWDTSKGKDWLGVIISSCLQAPLALGLYYAELLADVLRDELEWQREMMPLNGSNGTTGALRQTARRLRAHLPEWLVDDLPEWPSIAFFLFKGFIQWIFSCTLWIQYATVIALLPLIVLSVLLLALAITAEILTRRHPKLVLPTTYGNLKLCREMLESKRAQAAIIQGHC